MKITNNKGISLAETLAATVILGIVFGATFTALNSRAKQLKIINDKYEINFDLNNSSNEAYLNKGFDELEKRTYDAPDGSSHTIKKGVDIDSSLNANKSYLVSSINVDGEDYKIIREVSKGSGQTPGGSSDDNESPHGDSILTPTDPEGNPVNPDDFNKDEIHQGHIGEEQDPQFTVELNKTITLNSKEFSPKTPNGKEKYDNFTLTFKPESADNVPLFNYTVDGISYYNENKNAFIYDSQAYKYKYRMYSFSIPREATITYKEKGSQQTITHNVRLMLKIQAKFHCESGTFYMGNGLITPQYNFEPSAEDFNTIQKIYGNIYDPNGFSTAAAHLGKIFLEELDNQMKPEIE